MQQKVWGLYPRFFLTHPLGGVKPGYELPLFVTEVRVYRLSQVPLIPEVIVWSYPLRELSHALLQQVRIRSSLAKVANV